VTHRPSARSYRALLQVPGIGRILLSMQLGRIAGSMISVAFVLFTLQTYRSPALTGLVTFASVFPGLVVSPIAGALLDRHGRVRLIALDYVVEMCALVLVGVLSLAGLLPAWLLVLIATVASLTGILSHTGLRSLFPLIVPRHLWERVNALDSNGYVVATILGPPIAAALVALIGPQETMILIGVVFGAAALILVGVREPVTKVQSTGRLLVDAWLGLRYVWGNRTLRGLGFSVSVLNLAGGMATIAIPLILLDELGFGPTTVGLAFAVSGVTGMISAFLFGRMDTRGREWPMLWLPMLALTGSVALLLPAAGFFGHVAPLAGLALVAASQLLFGFLNGPLDIAMFTVRQRRTDPAWLGRAFAVSMAFNFMGFPIGAALAGALADVSLTAAIIMGIAACLTAAVLAAILVPAHGDGLSQGIVPETAAPGLEAVQVADDP
jgi:MFS family permease